MSAPRQTDTAGYVLIAPLASGGKRISRLHADPGCQRMHLSTRPKGSVVIQAHTLPPEAREGLERCLECWR